MTAKLYTQLKKIFVLITICISIIIPDKAHSLDMTVGATTWLLWGNRNEDIMPPPDGGTDSRRYYNNTNYSFDPSFLYGPALSVKFNDDFNLTFVYLYGKFEHKSIYTTTYGSGHDSDVIYKFKRSDSDLALNYRLNNYFKVFAGMKYMKYDIKLTDVYNSGGGTIYYYCDTKHTSYGPGLGLSGTYPLTENIFLLGTLSGFYLFNTGERFKDKGVYNVRTFSNPTNYKIGYKEYGMNSTLSIAYYIAHYSTVISLGGRFQYFKTDYEKKYIGVWSPDNFYINSITNKMYGITLTATYSFSI